MSALDVIDQTDQPVDQPREQVADVIDVRHRLRCRYTKNGKIRFLGHRDVARCWERAIRRARLPVIYSEGFSPRPRLHFGLALSVGFESDAEYIDIDVSGDVDLASALTDLGDGLPPGIDVLDLVEVSMKATALQAVVSSSTWRAELLDADRVHLETLIDDLQSADTRVVTVERKGRPVEIDVVEQVLAVETLPGGSPEDTGLLVDLSTDGRSLRPAEFFASFTPPLEPRRVRRLQQWVHREGERVTPLECDPPSPSPT
jgi:radical SAM-linked protein